LFSVAAVAVSLALAVPAQAHPGSVWRHYSDANGGGVFENIDPGRWLERVANGARYDFVEVRRTAGFVELYDGSRGVSVRLYGQSCYILQLGLPG
jgi:hypothetical protein